MSAALRLARRGLGQVWPNPAVGCVLVRSGGGEPGGRGLVVGRGWTQRGGRPHGEAEAIRRAGDLAHGATAYISLEPCNHHGRTPPCTEALLDAGVARAVIAAEDPDPRVRGAGVARLRAGGVDVVEGVMEPAARALNEGFFLRVERGRPLITLKLATTLDGRLATSSGESQWITGEVARAAAHALRASHDAIMVGSGTATIDDPSLTCRLPGMADASPVRIVVDGRLRMSLTSQLVRTAQDVPTWLVTRRTGDRSRKTAFRDAGVEVIELDEGEVSEQAPLDAVLAELGRRGLTRVLVEGGSHLAASLVQQDLIDRLVWVHAPAVMGGDGLPALQPIGVGRMAELRRFRRVSVRRVGEDVLETYGRPT